MQPVTIYTTPTCQFCKKAKEFLSENSVAYVEKDITTDQQARKDLMDKGYRGVPVIRVGENDVVGFDQAKLKELLEL